MFSSYFRFPASHTNAAQSEISYEAAEKVSSQALERESPCAAAVSVAGPRTPVAFPGPLTGTSTLLTDPSKAHSRSSLAHACALGSDYVP